MSPASEKPDQPTQNPDLRRALDMFVSATPELGAPVEAWRAGFDRMCSQFDVPADTSIEPVTTGGVPGLLVSSPAASRDHVIIHLHSGGYMLGSSHGYRNFASRLSSAAGVSVLVPDFRLAPEHRYPAALEDTLAAYRWCLERFGASKIVLCGDSAGGGLVVSALMSARDSGLPMPAAAVAISPYLDAAGEGESALTNAATDPLINRQTIIENGKIYLGDLDPKTNPLASPLWGQHHGFPALLLLASASETLRDDAVRLARSVTSAGGKATLHLSEGMIHIWTLFPFLEESTRSMQLIGGFVRKEFAIA